MRTERTDVEEIVKAPAKDDNIFRRRDIDGPCPGAGAGIRRVIVSALNGKWRRWCWDWLIVRLSLMVQLYRD